MGRQRSAAAGPAPGLSLRPTPVSSLLGNQGEAKRCRVGGAGIFRLDQPTGTLTTDWSAVSPQLLVPASVNCLRLGSMMCTLLLILLRQWKRCVLGGGGAACSQGCLCGAWSILSTDPLLS